MRGGDVGTIIAGLLVAAFIVAAAIVLLDWIQRSFAELLAEQSRADAAPWGDVVELPHGAKATGGKRIIAGEGAANKPPIATHVTRSVSHSERGVL